jgi:hypothetical protein
MKKSSLKNEAYCTYLPDGNWCHLSKREMENTPSGVGSAFEPMETRQALTGSVYSPFASLLNMVIVWDPFSI